MSITLVTTTRNRALCFTLLELWMSKQTMKWDQWLVINDGTEEYNYTSYQDVIQRDPSSDTLPSICHNWLEAIPLILGDTVVVVEDDDYYHPKYLETITKVVNGVDLAGISHDVYYKLPTRRFERMHNGNHASLAASAFQSSVLPQVERCCRLHKSVFIDMYLWVECGPVWPGTKKLLRQPLEDGRMLHLGMKNMPGAAGLGMGHAHPEAGMSDTNFALLTEWAGPEAASIYRRIWRDNFNKS